MGANVPTVSQPLLLWFAAKVRETWQEKQDDKSGAELVNQ